LAPDGYVIDNPNPVEFNVTAGTGALSPLNFYDTQIKTGSWNPTAIKKLDGKDILHIFNFEILEGTTSLLTGSTKNVLPNGDYSVEFAMKVGIDPNNILNFTNNHYFADSDPTGTQYLVATKNFNMKEITGNLAGYSYDTTIHALVLKVYNVKGQSNLKMVIEDPNGTVLSDNSGNFKSDEIPTFLNTYKANGSIQLSAQKVLEGHGLAAGQFSFDLYEGSTLLETVQNKVGITSDNISYVGDIDFSVINYKLSDIGTKNYTIVEKDTKLQGYSYDTTVYNVEVQVTDNDTGILTSSITSIKKVVNGVTTDVTMVAFKNTYATSDTTTQISATKNLTGHSLEDHQFSFILNQVTAQGLLIKQISTTTNEGNNIIFPSISFNQNDIGESYYFQVSEVNDHIPGYIYDNSVYAVKVDVVDNNNGTITTVNTITKNSIVYPQVIFNNIYKLDGKVEITFTNDLTGKKIENEEFTFVLQQIDIKDNTIIGEEIIAKNSPSGQIYFPDLKYTEADTGKDFYYKLYQKNDNIAGYTYDMKVYYILVSVSDNGDGKLGITQKITASQGETKISFSTSYVPVVNSDEDILNKGTSIKTGDKSELLLYIILLVISTSVLISYRFKKRENLISH